MSQLEKLAQLRALFTPANVTYLDTILSLLLRGRGPLHSAFWGEFQQGFNAGEQDIHYRRAWNALLQLHELVKSEL